MKITKILFLSGLCLLSVLACQKEKSIITPDVISKTAGTQTLQKGEPLAIELKNVPPTSNIAWAVFPLKNIHLVADKNKARITFNSVGTFTITARLMSATDTSIVYCDTVIVGDTTNPGGPVDTTHYCDSIVHTPGGDTVYHIPCDTIPHNPGDTTSHQGTYIDVTNDQLVITPLLMDSGLVFNARTVNSYNCLNAYLQSANYSSDTTGIYVSYSAVFVPPAASCAPGQSVARTGNYILNYTQDGIYDVHIQKGSVTYSGTLTVSSSGAVYTFNWPYSSGVTISPTSLTR
jgi:hypothetical protein